MKNIIDFYEASLLDIKGTFDAGNKMEETFKRAQIQLNELESVLLNKSYLMNPYGDSGYYKYMMDAPDLCKWFNINALNGSILIEMTRYTPDGREYFWDVQLKGEVRNSVYETFAKREFDCVKDKVKNINSLLKKIRPFFENLTIFEKEIINYKY